LGPLPRARGSAHQGPEHRALRLDPTPALFDAHPESGRRHPASRLPLRTARNLVDGLARREPPSGGFARVSLRWTGSRALSARATRYQERCRAQIRHRPHRPTAGKAHRHCWHGHAASHRNWRATAQRQAEKSVPGRTQLSAQAPRRAARPELPPASAPHDGQPPRPRPAGLVPGSLRPAWPEQRGADCFAAGCRSDLEGPQRDHYGFLDHCRRLSTHRRHPASWKPPGTANSSQASSHAATAGEGDLLNISRRRQPHTGVRMHSRPLWEPHHRRGAPDLTNKLTQETESRDRV